MRPEPGVEVLSWRSLRLCAGAVALAAALQACTSAGPPFVPPPPPDEPGFRHATGTGGTRAALPVQWWQVFEDPVLDRLQAQALERNTDLRAAASRLLQARAQLMGSQAGTGPTVGLAASMEELRSSGSTPQARALGNRSISGTQLGARALFAYELDLWGRLGRIVEAADARLAAAQADQAAVALLLSTQIAGTYWQLRGLELEAGIVAMAIRTRQDTQELVSVRFERGLSNELELSRAKLELASARADGHELQRQAFALQHALATLTGVSPARAVPWTDGQRLPPPPLVPVGLPAGVIAQRPDLRASIEQLRSAHADVGIADAERYPTVSLTGNYGHASDSLRSLTQGHSRVWNVGPLSVTWPAWDGGRSSAAVTLARARYEEARARHEGRVLTALREVEDALSDAEQRERQADAQRQAGQAAQRMVEVASARYERGLSSFLEVADAQRAALATDRASAQIAAQRLLASVALVRALGGAWQAPASGAVQPDAAAAAQ